MRRRIGWAAFLALVGTAAGTLAQSPPGGPEEVLIRSLDEDERAAVLAGNRSALERLWSDDFTVNAPTNRVVVGRSAVLDLIDLGVIHYASFERSVELVRIDGDLGIVMGAEVVRPIGKAPMAGQSVARRFTNVWKKKGGTWRMVARHANVVAPSPRTLRHSPTQWGSAGSWSSSTRGR
jgi:ketosteroid isomerase-like protein